MKILNTHKISNTYRILDLFVRLCEGKRINKQEEARRFEVSEKSIQRDINFIRCFLTDRRMMYGSEYGEVVFERSSGTYKLEGG